MRLQEYIEKHGNVEIKEKALNELLGIKESKVWKPNKNELYWSVCNDGGVASVKWLNTTCDNDRWVIGNVFKTKEEAEFAVEKRKVEVELQRYADEHNECEIDWENETQTKYFIFCDYRDMSLNVTYHHFFRYNTVYFTSDDIAEQAVRTIGTDRLKKYYFGVDHYE